MIFPRKKLIAIDIDMGSYQDFIYRLVGLASYRTSSYTCVANVHMLVEAYKNKDFAKVVNQADVITPDGMPIAKGMNLIYGVQQDRVAGMTLLPDLLHASLKHDLSVFFYGGTAEMLYQTEKYCKKTLPGLKIAGVYSPPFRPLTAAEETEIIDRINASGAHFVFVALGCPKQEKWMASMKGRINACMVGIGGSLPVMIGMQKRAPDWMQRNSLEWLFRLTQEPKRLFKRYAITNHTFLYLLFRTYAKQGFKKKPLQVDLKNT
ncbi:WecB/TagA/CpsF family glycosyltransferase [Anditalea andensis]|uniref:Glycosyl transferase n=1 Tax=Anditalea andensis TaxID=1048983 RepID=A0A074KU82_9BACT|nr:WecB/TagA/CpsF family glycosyltransferase [Anditalea andensis]KEO71825.1 glycosyl transferase [Anditalea andensis]